MKTVEHKADLCVVGGGLAGMCAAIAAARRGSRVVLMQDRPVLGGNASSEIRMWVCGAHGEDNRETGILEEISLENLYRNPRRNYSIWDSVLYEKVRFQDNLTLLMNCTCQEASMQADRIGSIRGWQMTTQTYHIVEADLFADCSGDSILAVLSGADYRLGREAASEYGESIEPEEADEKVMGHSLLIQAREMPEPQPFIPPRWAYTYRDDSELPHRDHRLPESNFWWIELGGEQDPIHDTEAVRDELLKVAFGVWDHIKNQGEHGADNWALDWMGFLPGKRESRRYLGDHVLTQNDIEAGGHFRDTVAYGGWTMDDHHPGGIRHKGQPTIFHPAPSPFGIPYRSLYSRNVGNLFCAGRNISTSHAGLSATRVMATCATVGQAVGTAAAIALSHGLQPRQVYEQKIDALQQMLLEDDCYLPRVPRRVGPLTAAARVSSAAGHAEQLRSGWDRPIDGAPNCWTGPLGSAVEYHFDDTQHVSGMRFVFDSDLNRPNHNMPCNYPLNMAKRTVPKTMIKAFRIDVCTAAGEWTTAKRVEGNYQRLVHVDLDVSGAGFRFVPEESWGNETVRVFAWDLL